MYGYEILHNDIAENLIQNVRSETARHAYIFEGEKGVGSLEAARLFAAAQVCENIGTAPCGACHGCTMASAGTHPDIRFTEPENGKRGITVDQIRGVVTDAYTKPFDGGKKVYIIKYGDNMNEQAQNAFLKVLEEPPQYAVFIILAENSETLLSTIRSRCILIRFNPVSDGQIREYIRRHFPDEGEKTDFLVHYAGGVAGNVEKILSQENFFALRGDSLEKLNLLMSDNLLDAYAAADFVEENKDDADLILRLWQEFLRDVTLIQNGAGALAVNSDLSAALKDAAARYDEKRVVRAQEQIIAAQKMRNRYVSLHTLMLRLAFIIKRK